MMEKLVTIIVPVYKAEKYIQKCAESLLSQTYARIEYFFVNDCTPDKSIEILEKTIEKFPARKSSITIINFENNLGHAHARNVALKQCHGEYVIQIDADDWAESTMVEKMLHCAIENNSDIVACDFIREEKDKSVYWTINSKDISREGLKNFKWLLEYSAHWNKLIRKSLIQDNSIYCIEGTNNWVDVGQIAPLRFVAERISVINEGLYHYNAYNENSVSRHFTDKRINDMIEVAKTISSFIADNGGDDFYYSTQYLCFISKFPLLHVNRNEYKRWMTIFPDSNKYIFRYPLTVKQKILYWLAAHHFYYPLRIIKMLKSK